MNEQYIDHAYFHKAAKQVDSGSDAEQVKFILCIENAHVSSEQLVKLMDILDNAAVAAKTVLN